MFSEDLVEAKALQDVIAEGKGSDSLGVDRKTRSRCHRLEPDRILEYYNSRTIVKDFLVPDLAAWKRRLDDLERRYRELARQLADIGFMHEGSVVRQKLACGKASCACHADPERRHGPYFYWTAKVKGRTKSRLLSEKEVALYQEWIGNRRLFRNIQRKMLDLAKRAAPAALKVREFESGETDV
jgi:hypothetical protein